MATILMMTQATLTPGDQHERVRVRNEITARGPRSLPPDTRQSKSGNLNKAWQTPRGPTDTGLVPGCPGRPRHWCAHSPDTGDPHADDVATDPDEIQDLLAKGFLSSPDGIASLPHCGGQQGTPECLVTRSTPPVKGADGRVAKSEEGL